MKGRVNWTENRIFFSQYFHYETAPFQDSWKNADFSSCPLKKKCETFNGKIIIILLSSIKQFKAERKESQLFVKHIDLKYERNLWSRRKDHGLLLITETPLICVANKPEWNRWDAFDNVRQVLSLYPVSRSIKSGADYYVAFEVPFLSLMLSFYFRSSLEWFHSWKWCIFYKVGK